MTEQEVRDSITQRLDDIASLYKGNQVEEGFKRLVVLFVDLAAAFGLALPEEKQPEFILELTGAMLLDMSHLLKMAKQLKEENTPQTIKMDVGYKS